MKRTISNCSIILLFLCLTVIFSLPYSAHAFTTTDYCMEQEEQSFLTLLNTYRISNGLGALTPTQSLGAAAENHSIDMATYNYFSHTLAGPDHILGTTDDIAYSQNIRNFGYTYPAALGENIAAGYQTASDVFTAWKNSSGHNANMLSIYFQAAGIGRSYGATSTYGYYWTNDFGSYIDSPHVTRCNDGSNPDNNPPTLQVTSPAANQTVSGVVPLTVTATDDRSIQRVEYFNRTYDTYSTPFAASTSSPYTVSFDSLHAPNGINHLLVRAFDGYWNSVTVPLDVTVQNTSDTTPPVASLATPTNGSTIANPVILTVNATDNVGVYRVDYYVDTYQFTKYYPSFTENWANASAGTHTVYAKVQDFQGNVTITTPISFTVSTTAPTTTPTPILTPTPTATPFPTPTAKSTPTPTSIPTLSPSVTPTSTPLPTATPTPTNTPILTSTPTPTPAIADSTPPTVTITYPVNNAIVARRSKVTITASATDNLGVSKVDFSVNNKLICSSLLAPYSCIWNISNKAGTSTIQAKAYDLSGNTAVSSITVRAQ